MDRDKVLTIRIWERQKKKGCSSPLRYYVEKQQQIKRR